jgi:hypothetical protein
MLRPANRSAVDRLAKRFAGRYHIRIYQFANVGNHLHMVVRAPDRLGLQGFLRTFAGGVAAAITGARRGAPAGRFWEFTAYSRMLFWGRAFAEAIAYVRMNALEGAGVITERMKARTQSAARATARPPPGG